VTAAAPVAGRPMQAAYRTEHDFWHRKWRNHERDCLRCLNARRCRIADRYATLADDAGKRWRLAEDALISAGARL
jgi:hypothetical protein